MKYPTVNIKYIKTVLENSRIFKYLPKYQLPVMNPQPSQGYSLIKLPKRDFSIRLVVSYVTAAAVEILKFEEISQEKHVISKLDIE